MPGYGAYWDAEISGSVNVCTVNRRNGSFSNEKIVGLSHVMVE